MFAKYSTRRKFLNYISLSFLFLLSSCSGISRKVKISLQSSFYPNAFKKLIPNIWQQKNVKFESIQLAKNRKILFDSDFALVNDGWLSSIDFSSFEDINQLPIFDNLDKRSIGFLKNFEEYQRNKLFPIGVIPYAIIIKNNKELINLAEKSWDFLLAKELSGKIIFPQSPRLTISIAKRINSPNSLFKLKKQAMLYEDRNALNWLINSDACVAIIPYSLCLKYFKLDSRLAIVFPERGVPLMWHFVLSKNYINNEILIEWIKSFKSKSRVDKLSSQGWYLPFKNKYVEQTYNSDALNMKVKSPTQTCWGNSWSLPPLTESQRIILENSWNAGLTP